MKKLAAACALACGTLAAGGAHAAFPFDPVQVDLYQSGASAVQNNLIAKLSSLFQPGYKIACDNISTNCSAYFSVTGTLATAAPVPATIQGKTARIVYRTKGGSGQGVGPVAKAQPLEWMPMNAATCSTTPPAGETFVADYYCSPQGTDLVSGRVPDVGLSDVEPKMFQAPLNVEYGQTALDPYNLGGLTNFAVYQQAFGMPMTNVIPTGLMVDRLMFQGMLSKSGVQHDWTKVNGLSPAQLAAINGSTSSIKPVVVCRRVQGSGTQATTNYWVSGFGCNTPYVVPSRMADSDGFGAAGTGTSADPIIIDPSAGYTVVENPASGDVRTCLADAQSGTNWTFKGDDGLYYQVTFSGVGANGYSNVDPTVVAPFGATGVLSYDSAGKENGWHFHDIGGVLTANAAAIDASGRPATSTAKYATAGMVEGLWDYFSEESIQYRNGANGQPALTGDLKTFADGLIHVLGDPAVINANLGIAALPNQYAATMNVTTNKVAKGTKSGDTCKQKQISYTPQYWQ